MKVHDLIEKLKNVNPSHDVVFWDGEDNWDVTQMEVDVINEEEVVLFNQSRIV